MNQAKTLVGDNPIIQGLIAKEMVSLLAPPEEIYEYQQAVLKLSSPEMQALAEDQESEVYTRDIGDQTPDTGSDESVSEMIENQVYSGVGTGITYTGQSSYNPIADQLVGQAAGR
jgi:hypothetical protein